MISKIDPLDIHSITFEKTKVEPKPKQHHYVDNKELQEEFLKYYNKKQQWIKDGKEGHPPLTNKIGEAILLIANKRVNSRKFVGYSQDWKEAMIGDAIEVCVRYGHNYNAEKYSNPFAYLTQIISYAIINRIKKEKKNTYIKYKSFEMVGGFAAYFDENMDPNDIPVVEETSDIYQDYMSYISEYEEKEAQRKKSKEKDLLEEEDLGILEFLE